MAYRILSHTWSVGSDFSSQYAYRIDAVKAMAHKQANAPDVSFELVTEQQFQAWINKQSA